MSLCVQDKIERTLFTQKKKGPAQVRAQVSRLQTIRLNRLLGVDRDGFGHQHRQPTFLG
jgi:hypothetical protein